MTSGKFDLFVNLIVLTIMFLSALAFESSARDWSIDTEILVDHEPIFISGDQNFTDYGFPGNGSESNPFIISNLRINSTTSNHNNIMIMDTTKHFIIENSVLSKPSLFRYPNFWSSRLSIYIRNCEKGTATIRNSMFEGICVSNTSNCIVEYNEIKDSVDNGIYLRESQDAIVRNNFIHNNGAGIHTIYTQNCTFERNIISCNDGYLHLHGGIDDLIVPSGIFFEGNSSYNIIRDNYFTNNRDSISIWNSGGKGILISSNTITDSMGESIFCEFKESTIINNTIMNGDKGIYLREARRNTISYNNISNNGWYGVSLYESCLSNRIHHNRFIDNGLWQREHNKTDSQARDFGSKNLWYDETTFEGNYWSDLDGVIPYSIDGPSESIDPYPLSYIFDGTYSTINPLLSILPSVFVISYFIKRRRTNTN